MREPVTYVTQSKYFSPAFNAAIFDGPIRIYFAQYQEPQALKVYFSLQERFQDMRKNGVGIFKNRARNVFLMLYPNEETFDLSFSDGSLRRTSIDTEAAMFAGATAGTIACQRLGDDFVIGVRGVTDDLELDELYLELDEIVNIE